jgi:hypothetical protein
MVAYLTKCASVQKSHLASYYLFLLICISSYWQDQLCHHHGIIQASFGYLKVRFPGSEVGHKRTILKINMVINVCIYIVLLKNTFISYNNNIQQIGYALELSPVNIFWNICPIVYDILGTKLSQDLSSYIIRTPMPENPF